MILLNNIRAVVIAFLLSVISFSVLGMIAYLVNMVLIGGLLGVLNIIGISPLGIFAVGILPHGIFELTAVVLASAALLNLGVKLVTPDPQHSFGEIFFQSAADWAKIFAGICLPLLVVAAIIEANVTAGLLINYLK
jgi:stage II sporulation protein M